MERVQSYMNYGDLAPATRSTQETVKCGLCKMSMVPSSVAAHVLQQHLQQYKEYKDRTSPSPLKRTSPSLSPEEPKTSGLDQSQATDRPLNLRGRRVEKVAPRQCGKCDEMVNRSSIYAHVRLHCGVKPIECSECGKQFGFGAISFATKHVNELHTNAAVIDNREEHRAAVRHMRQLCFPVEETNQENEKVIGNQKNVDTEQPEQKRAKLTPIDDSVFTQTCDNGASTQLDQKPTIEQLQSMRLTAKNRELNQAFAVCRALRDELLLAKEELTELRTKTTGLQSRNDSLKQENAQLQQKVREKDQYINAVKQFVIQHPSG